MVEIGAGTRRLARIALAVVLLALVPGRASGQPIPPADAHCIAELSRAIGVFTAAVLNEVLPELIGTGGVPDPDPSLSEDLRESILENCSSIPAVSDKGVCGGQANVSDWADCVVASQEAAIVELIDDLLGAPPPTPTPTVQPTAPPTAGPTPRRCAGRNQPCFGNGVSGCCTGFECRFTGISPEPVCLPIPPPPPPPPSASGAFLDGEGARFY